MEKTLSSDFLTSYSYNFSILDIDKSDFIKNIQNFKLLEEQEQDDSYNLFLLESKTHDSDTIHNYHSHSVPEPSSYFILLNLLLFCLLFFKHKYQYTTK